MSTRISLKRYGERLLFGGRKYFNICHPSLRFYRDEFILLISTKNTVACTPVN
jgi:hypothetical protein